MISCTLQNQFGTWITNINEYDSPDEIDWEGVEKWCKEHRYLAYGYQKGARHSRNLTSPRTRTVLWTAQ